jgi:sarcosine oxidase
MNMERYDVIVAGLGAWGSAAARELAKRGHRVLGFDQHYPPHGHGSHSGITRLARRSSHEGVEYAPLTARAFDLWHELEHESGTNVVVRTGALLFGASDDPLIKVSADSLDQQGLPYEILDREQLASRFPAFNMSDDEQAVFEPDACVLLSADGITALHRAAIAHGAHLRTGERVCSWQQENGGVTVQTDQGTYEADRLVLTLGAWNADFLGLDLPLEVERQVLVTFDTREQKEQLPCLFARSSMDGEEEVGFYGAPEPDGRFKFALHHGGITGHPDELPSEVTAEDIDRIRAEVRERLPQIAALPAEAKSCMYTNTPDHHWILGVHPEAPRVAYSAGCSGRGFRYAPAIGEALADLTEGRPRPDLDFLSPQRFVRSAAR